MNLYSATMTASKDVSSASGVVFTVKTVTLLLLANDEHEATESVLADMERACPEPGWVFSLPSIILATDAQIRVAYQCLGQQSLSLLRERSGRQGPGPTYPFARR